MMIEVEDLAKTYGSVTAVDGLSFTVEPGKVTGFLGPNGAGKSTTMRMMLGLDRPSRGSATINGRRYGDQGTPMREVGALLDATAMHPGRTGAAHLRIAAQSNGIPMSRVEATVELVGLTGAARRRIKGYSLGMRQRLGIAAALLGDPPVLLFDEPVNGLDLDGVRWIRALLRGFADEGRTVLVSSHLLSEMQLIADRVIVIGRGRLLADTTIDEVLHGSNGRPVRIQSPRLAELEHALSGRADYERIGSNELEVLALTPHELGDLAHARGIPVHHLSEVEQSLEQAYLSLTEHDIDHQAKPTVTGNGDDR